MSKQTKNSHRESARSKSSRKQKFKKFSRINAAQSNTIDPEVTEATKMAAPLNLNL